MSDSVRPHRRQPTRLPRPWDSPGTGRPCQDQHLFCQELLHQRFWRWLTVSLENSLTPSRWSWKQALRGLLILDPCAPHPSLEMPVGRERKWGSAQCPSPLHQARPRDRTSSPCAGAGSSGAGPWPAGRGEAIICSSTPPSPHFILCFSIAHCF